MVENVFPFVGNGCCDMYVVIQIGGKVIGFHGFDIDDGVCMIMITYNRDFLEYIASWGGLCCPCGQNAT